MWGARVVSLPAPLLTPELSTGKLRRVKKKSQVLTLEQESIGIGRLAGWCRKALRGGEEFWRRKGEEQGCGAGQKAGGWFQGCLGDGRSASAVPAGPVRESWSGRAKLHFGPVVSFLADPGS